jgi:hypothetical protein
LDLGDLVRWRWVIVERFIDELEKLPAQADANDPYLARLKHGSSSEADD